MKKEERHQKSEEFRAQIKFPAQRAEAIRSLISKEKFDEVDQLRISILFNKVSNASGCEQEYKQLIVRLYDDSDLREKASDFYKRWNAK